MVHHIYVTRQGNESPFPAYINVGIDKLINGCIHFQAGLIHAWRSFQRYDFTMVMHNDENVPIVMYND